jgi:hypothetical protein
MVNAMKKYFLKILFKFMSCRFVTLCIGKYSLVGEADFKIRKDIAGDIM